MTAAALNTGTMHRSVHASNVSFLEIAQYRSIERRCDGVYLLGRTGCTCTCGWIGWTWSAGGVLE